MLLYNSARCLSGLRTIDEARYYSQLILKALGDVGYLVIILIYSTIIFGVVFQVSRHDALFDFKSLWIDSSSFYFGNFKNNDDHRFSFNTIFYMLSTILNITLILNLLISILGDTYFNINKDKFSLDYNEKASIILEIQKKFYWLRKVNENKYFHVMLSSIVSNEDEKINEKITGIETSLDNLHEEVRNHTEANGELFNDKLAQLENKINDKIGQVEGKITEINETMKQILEFIKPKSEGNKQE